LIVSALAAAAQQYSLTPSFQAGVQPPAATKPFATFAEFYPFYLTEHSGAETRMLHYTGTSLFLACLFYRPRLLFALLPAAMIGNAVFPFFRHLPSGLPELALMMGTYILLGRGLTRSWVATLLPLVLAYGCAWVGHFKFEGNKPATFIYPAFSLFGSCARCCRNVPTRACHARTALRL
ncbi:DUF962 domain-containing protein, partial [archaeon]